MDVKIFKPSKSVTQSGRGKSDGWVLEYETNTAREAEPLMGWTSSHDTLNQVRLKFDDKESAIAFAESKGWSHIVLAENKRVIKPRNYGDNFKYIPHDEAK